MNLKRIIREEMEDFGFVDKIPELHGVSFKVENFDNPVYTIIDKGDRYYVEVTWTYSPGNTNTIREKRSVVMKLFKNGTWEPII